MSWPRKLLRRSFDAVLLSCSMTELVVFGCLRLSKPLSVSARALRSGRDEGREIRGVVTSLRSLLAGAVGLGHVCTALLTPKWGARE